MPKLTHSKSGDPVSTVHPQRPLKTPSYRAHHQIFLVALQIYREGQKYKHGDPGHQNALWVHARPDVFGEGELSQEAGSFAFFMLGVEVMITDRINKLLVVSSQLKKSILVDRVEQKEDHVIVYIQEVRGIQSEEQKMIFSRCVTDSANYFCPTVTTAHSNQLYLRARTGHRREESEACPGPDL